MYWHRHGLCSLILAQHAALGLLDDVIADAHGLSCSGLQVTAFVTSTSPRISTRTTQSARNVVLVFMSIFCFFCFQGLGWGVREVDLEMCGERLWFASQFIEGTGMMERWNGDNLLYLFHTTLCYCYKWNNDSIVSPHATL